MCRGEVRRSGYMRGRCQGKNITRTRVLVALIPHSQIHLILPAAHVLMTASVLYSCPAFSEPMMRAKFFGPARKLGASRSKVRRCTTRARSL